MDTKSLSLKTVRIIAQSVKYDWIHPHQNDNMSKSVGTGFFIDNKGTILTCAHVIINSKKIVVEVPNIGKEKIDVEVLGICPELDIALLRTIKYKNKEFYELHDEDYVFKLEPGLDVYAIGFPLGQDNIKFSKGIISGRQNGLIQTDTAINPGNSGGPMIFENKVIGINTSKNIGSNIDNIGFATPVKYFHLYKNVLESQKKNLLVKVPDIGLKVQNTSPALNEILKSKCKQAVLVTKVFKDSPIFKTGIKAGDVLCKINEIAIDNFGLLELEWFNQKMSLEDYLLTLKLKSKIKILFNRNGRFYEKTFLNDHFSLKITKKYPIYESKKIDYEIFGGITVMELTQNHIEYIKQIVGEVFKLGNIKESILSVFKYFDVENCDKSKLIITHIFPNSYLSNYELLNKFDVISHVNNRECNTIEQYRSALLQKKKNKFITIKTESNNQAVLDLNDIKISEPIFSDLYKYSLSQTYSTIFKKRHRHPKSVKKQVSRSRSKSINRSRKKNLNKI
jgi:S1-C subfamily serine protease